MLINLIVLGTFTFVIVHADLANSYSEMFNQISSKFEDYGHILLIAPNGILRDNTKLIGTLASMKNLTVTSMTEEGFSLSSGYIVNSIIFYFSPLSNRTKEALGKRSRNNLHLILSEGQNILPNGIEIKIDIQRNSWNIACPGDEVHSPFNIRAIDKFSYKNLCKKSLVGKEVTFSIVGTPPYTYPNSLKGSTPDLYKAIGKYLKIKPKWKFEKGFGTFDKEKRKYTGMIGSIAYGQSDVALALLNSGRFKVLDPSPQIYPIEIGFVSAHPLPVDNFLTALRPFSARVWIIWTSLLLTLSMINYFIGKTFKVKELYSQTPFDSLIQVLAFCVEQTLSLHLTKYHSANIFVMVVGIFALLMGLFYKSNFLAVMVKVDYEKPLDTAENIFLQNKDVYFPSQGLIAKVMRESKNHWHKNIYQKTLENGNTFDIRKGVTKELLEDIANHKAVITLAKIWGVQQDFHPSEESILTGYQTVLYRKDYPWKEHFNEAISRLTSTGVILKMVRDNTNVKRRKEPNQQLTVLSINHLWTPILILVIGWTISFGFACLEHLMKRHIR